MADAAITTGQQMSREEMIKNIINTAKKIKATKKQTEKMKQEILQKIKIFEEMDKSLEVAQMEVEMDEKLALV